VAIITHDELEARLGESFTATQDAIADAAIVDATALVEAYLGYAIESAEVTEAVNGNGTPYLMIKHKHITAASVTYVPDGSTENTDTYRIAPNGCALLKIDGYTWVNGYGNYSVVYTGGWAAEDIPQLLKSVITEIALMLYDNYAVLGIGSIKVDQIAYAYSEGIQEVVLSGKQKQVLNKYRCRRIG